MYPERLESVTISRMRSGRKGTIKIRSNEEREYMLSMRGLGES